MVEFKEEYYCIEGKWMRYLATLKTQLGSMKRLSSDDMRDHMNKLCLLLDDAVPKDRV